MNNELFQMCCYVSVVKNAIMYKKNVDFVDNTQHIESITFKFLPRRKFFRNYNLVAHGFYEWQKYLKQEGLTDIKLYTPIGEALKNGYLPVIPKTVLYLVFIKMVYPHNFVPIGLLTKRRRSGI